MKLLILASTEFVRNYEHLFNIINELDYELVGFVSLDNKRIFEKINDYTIYPLSYLNLLKYDAVLLNSSVGIAENTIIPELKKLNLPVQKVHTVYWLLQQIMIKKYEDCNDPAIQETLNYWKAPNELTVFNQHIPAHEHTYNEMFFDDSCGLPYIIFETVEGKNRRMYFPKDTGGERVKRPDGKTYIKDILQEQVPTSPHLYIKDEHKINYGDILIDAGVCEGNFALRYVDICSKVYLFEMDSKWWAPLYFSFRDCWDKVELVTKACSDAKNHGGGGDSHR